jgi:hypothetical protein
MTVDIEKVDFSKLYLMQDKKNYRFTLEGKTFKLQVPQCESPFGVEIYNNKEIVNLHFNPTITTNEDSNKVNNFLVYLRLIEKIYEQFNNEHLDKTNIPFVKLPMRFLQDISNSEFTSLFKSGIKGGTLVRTHLMKNVKFYKIVDGEKKECLKSELKGKQCIPVIDVNSIWIFKKKYGLLLYISELLIL